MILAFLLSTVRESIGTRNPFEKEVVLGKDTDCLNNQGIIRYQLF